MFSLSLLLHSSHSSSTHSSHQSISVLLLRHPPCHQLHGSFAPFLIFPHHYCCGGDRLFIRNYEEAEVPRPLSIMNLSCKLVSVLSISSSDCTIKLSNFRSTLILGTQIRLPRYKSHSTHILNWNL
jgi:hypothetical protein